MLLAFGHPAPIGDVTAIEGKEMLVQDERRPPSLGGRVDKKAPGAYVGMKLLWGSR
jgi:hypothetical protein